VVCGLVTQVVISIHGFGESIETPLYRICTNFVRFVVFFICWYSGCNKLILTGSSSANFLNNIATE
jgi:hypothetical protein